MATDFSYNEKTVNSGGPIKPSGINQPLDPRTEVKLYADIKLIPNPYVGMIITVLEDETNSNKMTDYKVLSLKADDLGVANSVVDRVQRYVEYLGVSGGSSGDGLTSEQAQQLQTAYEHSQSPHINTTDVNNAVSAYVTEHKSELKGDKGDTGATGADGVKGQDGITPTLRVGSVTTLEAGNNATVTMSESNNEYTLNFGIPKGAKGDTGASGSGDSGSVASSEWSGKVANFLGDSQTEANAFKTKPYYKWVKEILGLSAVNDYGISGTTIAKKNASDNTAMCVRYANMDNNADLICVMGGVNDTWFNCQLGKFGDTSPLTFYGAMEILCDGLLTKYSGKTIIFITPTEQNHNGCNSANKTGYTATDFANAMKRVCAKYSIPVFDANTCSGIYPLNQANAAIYTTDKLHLNNKGHEVLGNKLSKFILNGANVVMINNSEESGGGSTSETYGNIVVSKSTATIREGDTDTFTIKLDKAPTNSQTVNISSNNSDVTLSTNTLTFTPDNYNQTQEVRINIAEDSDAINDNCTLTLSSNNVSSKTITITITDNDSASDTPIENPFIGKTVTVTKNYDKYNYAHLTALLNVDEDMKNNSTYNIVLNGSNASNMGNASNEGGTLFKDNSGEVANGQGVALTNVMTPFTQTVSNGNLTITATPRNGAVSTNYVKVPIMVCGTVPYSFRIDEIKVIVNNVERKILKLGAFFASNKEALTIE